MLRRDFARFAGGGAFATLRPVTGAAETPPVRRFRAVRLAAALAVGALLAATVLALLPPAARPVMPPDPEARGEAFEQAIAAAVTRVRAPGAERWAVAIDPADLNAWLATRLPKWIAHDPALAVLEPACAVRLGAAEGALVLEAPLASSSDRLVGTLRLPIAVVGTEAGARLSLEVGGASIGRLPIPAFAGLADLGERLRDALARFEPLGAGQGGDLRFRLADDRTVELRAIACEPGRIVVECTTHPAIATGGGAR
ncbi:MAG: hypothetical protein RI967_71 [Planctomycetota bacterium]